MSLNIKDPATVALAEELARLEGVSKTAAVHNALSERLRRKGYSAEPYPQLLEEMRAIRERIAQLPVLDDRSDEDIVGFDEHGIPC